MSACTIRHSVVCTSSGSIPHPLRGGVNTPQLSHNTPTRLQGERREREEGDGWGKGRGEEKGREGTPMGWLKPPCSKSWKIRLYRFTSSCHCGTVSHTVYIAMIMVFIFIALCILCLVAFWQPPLIKTHDDDDYDDVTTKCKMQTVVGCGTLAPPPPPPGEDPVIAADCMFVQNIE